MWRLSKKVKVRQHDGRRSLKMHRGWVAGHSDRITAVP